MKIAYFGKKNPKIVDAPTGKVNGVTGEQETIRLSFVPFAQVEVADEIGKILLANAPDIFKRTDSEERRELSKPVVKTEGYVGEAHADQVPNLEKQVEAEQKAEEGKTIEEIVEQEKKKKGTRRGRAAKNKENEDA